MNRRQFILGLGTAASSALPIHAQTKTVPVVGFLSPRSEGEMENLSAAFIRGLAEAGFVPDSNVAIEFRFAAGRYEALPKMATELSSHGVAVIVASGGPPPTRAAMAATSKIPIVFVTGSDPVAEGLVASLNHPGGNVTGVAMPLTMLNAKRFELLQELLPTAATIAILVNPDFPNTSDEVNAVEAMANAYHRRLLVVKARSGSEIENAFATIAKERAGGVVVTSEPVIMAQIKRTVELADRFRVPAIYPVRDFIAAGGLASYGPSFVAAYRQAGGYVAKILSGTRPDNLPIEQSTKFDLAINMKTAKALGITIPPSLLARADEVIE